MERTSEMKRTDTVVKRPDEFPPEEEGESLSDLIPQQRLRAEQAVDIAAGIAKEMALLHQQGLVYGVLESRNIRISGGRITLGRVEVAAERREADDVRDFGRWLRKIIRALPQDSRDKRRIALGEIATRYFQPDCAPVPSQMKRVSLALCLLRVTSYGRVAPQAAAVSVREPVAVVNVKEWKAPARSPRKGKVLLLLRVVSEGQEETRSANGVAPPHKTHWYAAAIAVTGVAGALFYFTRGML